MADALITRARRRRLPSPEECRRLRVALGLSQQEVAREIGASAAAVSRWESGVRTPKGQLRERYSSVVRRMAAEDARMGVGL